MKRIVKSVLKPFWRLTAPVRKPILARLDARLATVVTRAVNDRILPELLHPIGQTLHRLDRIEQTLARADGKAGLMAEEMDLVLDGVSREIFRLQSQVEAIGRLIGLDDRDLNGGLALMDESAVA